MRFFHRLGATEVTPDTICLMAGVEALRYVYGTAQPPHYVGLAKMGPDSPYISLQRVPEPKTIKNRLHFDIQVDDVEQTTTQIEALGGRRLPLEDFQEYGFRWRVMADPEGNEFCLVYTTANGVTGERGQSPLRGAKKAAHPGENAEGEAPS